MKTLSLGAIATIFFGTMGLAAPPKGDGMTPLGILAWMRKFLS